MYDFFQNNVPSIVAVLLGILSTYTGYRLSRLKDTADRRKITYDAADGIRDDLMKQLEEANKRIDKKDETIDKLTARIQTLETANLDLKWELKEKTYQIAQLESTVAAIKDQILVLKTG